MKRSPTNDTANVFIFYPDEKYIMKTIYFLLILSFEGLLNAQHEPVNIDFQEADPLWSFAIQDTAFRQLLGQPGLNQSSTTQPLSLNISENDLFLVSTVFEPNGLFDIWGVIVDKIDLDSGQPLWKYSSTIYNGGPQDFYWNNGFTSSGEIDLVGVERYGEHDSANWRIGAYKSKVARRVLNKNTGELLDLSNSTDSIYAKTYPAQGFNFYPLVKDSLYLCSQMVGDDVGELGSPVYNYGITYKIFDKELKAIDSTRLLFDFEELGPFSIDQPSFIRKLNSNTLVSLAYKDRFDSWEINNGTRLLWTDISNPENIRIKDLKEYKDIIPATKESFAYWRFKCRANTIFLSHRYANFDIEANCAYILWLDDIGNVKTFVAVPKYNEHLYQTTDMFYANDDYAYLFAYPSHKEQEGFDIIKITAGEPEIEYVSSLTATKEGDRFDTQLNTIYKNQYLIFSGNVQRENNDTLSGKRVYCFDTNDLGLDLGFTSTTDLVEQTEFQISPNPAKGEFYIKSNFHSGQYQINIIASNGLMVKSLVWDGMSGPIDVEVLPAGTYLVQVRSILNNKMTTERLVVIK